MCTVGWLLIVSALTVAASYVPVVPVWNEGLLVRRDSMLSFVFKPSWKRVDDLGAKLDYQEYKAILRWPTLCMLELHVARYNKGGFLQAHTDVATGKLWRIQFILRNAQKGGELLCEHFILNWRNFKIFEPARYRHEVTKVKEGQRLVFNFGIWFAYRPPKYRVQRD